MYRRRLTTGSQRPAGLDTTTMAALARLLLCAAGASVPLAAAAVAGGGAPQRFRLSPLAMVPTTCVRL